MDLDVLSYPAWMIHAADVTPAVIDRNGERQCLSPTMYAGHDAIYRPGTTATVTRRPWQHSQLHQPR